MSRFEFDDHSRKGVQIRSDHEDRLVQAAAERLDQEVRAQFKDHEPAVWTRLVTALAAALLGLAGVSLLVVGTDWWINGGGPVTVTEVVCDDDYEYREEAGVEVEHFRSETGARCMRETYTDDQMAAAGWPLWLAAPAWLVAVVLFIGGGTVSLVVTIYGVAWVFTSDFADTAREFRIAWEVSQRAKTRQEKEVSEA